VIDAFALVIEHGLMVAMSFASCSINSLGAPVISDTLSRS
jgi:hypothetical protein